MSKTLLGLDLGTTSVKAGLFSTDGVLLASASEEYQLLTPAANEAELPAEIYWQASVKTIRKVLQTVGDTQGTPAAIAVSSQGETLIPIDKNGKALRNAIVWIDNRAEEQAKYLNSRLKDVYDITGIPDVIPTWTGCKIRWIRENEPDVFRNTHKFLLLQDYILYRLTGNFVTNGSISCTTLYFDIRNHQWWQDALEAIGISENLLPDILEAGEIVGTSTVSANQELGLEAPIQVIGGGMDQSAGAVGAGTITDGIASETTGSALCIQVVTRRHDLDQSKRIPVYIHSVPGLYLFDPVCPTAGMAYKWFKDTFATEEIARAEDEGSSVYDLLNQSAADIPAGSDGLIMLPHLMGAFCPNSNPDAKGSFTGFTIHHSKGHFVRAILEAVAYMLRQNLETVTASGASFTEIRATGGGAKSPLWNQIKADVCNLPVITLENEDTGLIGDAILAGTAIGIFPNIQDGCDRFVKIKSCVNPGTNCALYEKYYQNYGKLDQALDSYYKSVK